MKPKSDVKKEKIKASKPTDPPIRQHVTYIAPSNPHRPSQPTKTSSPSTWHPYRPIAWRMYRLCVWQGTASSSGAGRRRQLGRPTDPRGGRRRYMTWQADITNITGSLVGITGAWRALPPLSGPDEQRASIYRQPAGRRETDGP